MAKLLSTAGGKDKIKFGMTSFYGEFYAGKLSIKLWYKLWQNNVNNLVNEIDG